MSRRSVAAALAVILSAGWTLGANGPAASAGPLAAAPSPPGIGHVWQIQLENESETASFAPPGSYLHDTLLPSGVFLQNYYATGHVSLDNYLSELSGQLGNAETLSDCQRYVDFVGSVTPGGTPLGAGCVYPNSPSSVPGLSTQVLTLPDQLTATGQAWHGYMEDMGNAVDAGGLSTRETPTCGQPVGSTPGVAASSAGTGTTDGTQSATATDQYAARHNPFVYFHSLDDVPAGQTVSPCQQNVGPLVAHGADRLAADLASTNPPAFNWITPNLCDDGHDSPCVGVDVTGAKDGGLVSANRFLAKYIPMIESSAAYQHDGMIVITFDEAANTDASSCCGEVPGTTGTQAAGGGGKVGALLISRLLTPHASSCDYNHFSLLRSYEDLYGITTRGADGSGHLGEASVAPSFGTDVYGPTDTCGGPAPTTPEIGHPPVLIGGAILVSGLVLLHRHRSRRRYGVFP